MADIQRYPDNFETLALDAALRCEHLSCQARHLIYAACNKPKEEYLHMAADAQGVDIQMQDEIVEIKLPSLLYKRDKWKSMEFLLDPFTAALERWTEENAAPKFEQCTVCFTHVYRSDMPVRMIRDPDSMEVKRYLDVVASFLLLDDNGLLCDIRAPMVSLAAVALLSAGAHAADYDFDGAGGTDYYQGSSYEEVYGTQYNYDGRNIVDYQIPELEYGLFSTTQTGVMERTRLPGLQARVGGEANGAYGINESVAGTSDSVVELPYMTQMPQSGNGNGNNFTIVGTVGSKKAFTKLADLELLSNGAIGHTSIPSIGVNKYYVWEGETTNSMSKGVGHFEASSVWDGNGQIILSDITGTLIVTEEKTVAGYVIDQATRTQTVVVNTNDTQDLYFYNTPRGALMIRKVDSATGEPLEGAEFTVVPANSEQADTGLTGTTFTTDRSGQIVLEQLLPVSYVITETKAPENYVLDAQPQVTTVKAGDTSIVTFADSHKGSLTIHKLDALTHDPLEGVQFKLAYADGTVVDDGNLSSNGTYVTDRNGQIVVANITGTVVATEVATISGYVIDPESRSQTVEVRPNDAQHLTFYNAPKGSLVIQKYDKVTNQPLADAVFSITTANGEPVAANEGLTSTNGLYRTDENGMIILTKLTPQTYIVTETEAPKGYALDAQTQTVVVSSSDTQYLRFYEELCCKGC